MHKILPTLGVVALTAAWSTSVWARFGAKLDLQTFRDRCAHYRHLDVRRLETAPKVGTVAFFPTGVIEAGQTRFNFRLMRKAMRKAIKADPPAFYDRHLDAWIFPHDDGRSLFPIKKAAGGVFYKGRIFLFDGHHKALVSTFLRAPRLPIEIREDWSDLSFPDFLKRMRDNHYAHWVDHLGEAEDPVDLCALANDPNLLLARYLRIRVYVSLDFGRGIVIEETSGATRPLAVKLNHDIPFYEFEIADALRRHGVVFDERRREQDLTTSELRKYLAILRQERPDSRLRQILLLDEPKPFGKLDLRRLVIDHVTRTNCHDILANQGRAED